MAFTTWAALKTAILNAMADHASGKPFMKTYEFDGVTRTATDIKELQDFYEWVSKQAAKSSRPRPSFGRYRRFQ